MDRLEPELGRAESAEAGLLIAVPFYRRPDLVRPCLESLARALPELGPLGAALVLYNDSPDDPALAAELAAQAAALRLPVRIETNPANLGFVRTMNLAIADAVEQGRDLLILNSDVELEPGAIREMHRVSRLDPMIGFVNPRSNNATLATLPIFARLTGAARETQRAAAAAYSARLPELTFVPTAIGFCLLVRWAILAEFGGFDEIYGHGYNEENDLVMRAARCGYRAVLANHAFAWHEGEASFSTAAQTRDVWEKRNRALLDARYPEYAAYTDAWYGSPEAVAERLLASLHPDADGKLDVALDFSSFRTDHNGTFRAGHQLLAAAAANLPARFRLSVIATEEVYRFHDYAALGGPRVDPHDLRAFAAVFRVGQPYDWNAVQRLVMQGAAIGIYMLDTISIDCPPLYAPRLYNMWQFALDYIDLLATQSRQTEAAFRRRFHIPPETRTLTSPHTRDLADYALPEGTAPGEPAWLVVGNHFPHKYLEPTAAALAAAFPTEQVIALGVQPQPAGTRAEPAPPNLRRIEGGTLEESEVAALYANATLVIFPSHAEGFGFPLLHALAAEKPVFVRPLPVFRELHEALGYDPNVHFFSTTAELVRLLQIPPRWIPFASLRHAEETARSAREIFAALEECCADVRYERLVSRLRAMQFASDIAAPQRTRLPGPPQAEEAARFFAGGAERLAARVLSWPPAYAVIRLGFRALRGVSRAVRAR